MKTTDNRILRASLLWLALIVIGRPAIAQPPQSAPGKSEPQQTGGPERIILPGVGRLPAFSHATVSGDLIFIISPLTVITG